MSKIRSQETQPEIFVRKQLFAKGFRFKKNVRTLSGKPDIVLPKYRSIVFVNGCFWHGHKCEKGKLPVTNFEFWQQKIDTNRRRDKRNITSLKEYGWKVFVVWECQLSTRSKRNLALRKLISKIIH